MQTSNIGQRVQHQQKFTIDHLVDEALRFRSTASRSQVHQHVVLRSTTECFPGCYTPQRKDVGTRTRTVYRWTTKRLRQQCARSDMGCPAYAPLKFHWRFVLFVSYMPLLVVFTTPCHFYSAFVTARTIRTGVSRSSAAIVGVDLFVNVHTVSY